VDEESLRSKFLGALVGTATGDALGASVEGWRMLLESEAQALAERQGLLVYSDIEELAERLWRLKRLR